MSDDYAGETARAQDCWGLGTPRVVSDSAKARIAGYPVTVTSDGTGSYAMSSDGWYLRRAADIVERHGTRTRCGRLRLTCRDRASYASAARG